MTKKPIVIVLMLVYGIGAIGYTIYDMIRYFGKYKSLIVGYDWEYIDK